MGQGGSSEQQRSPYDDLESTQPASVPPAASAPSRLSLIPTVLQWQHGGRAVFVTGTFNNWAERIPMRQSRSDFTVCLNLPVGTFQYKFIVDNEWRFSPSQPLVQDTQGNVNNCITVLDEEDFMSEQIAEGGAFGSDAASARYSQSFSTDELQLAKDPPPLPCQLTRVILNAHAHATLPTMSEEFPIPLPCMLLHLTWQQVEPTRRHEEAVIVSASHRFRAKFVTLVLYKPARLRGAGAAGQQQPQQASLSAAADAAGSHGAAVTGTSFGAGPRAGNGAQFAPSAGGGAGDGAAFVGFAQAPRPPSLMQLDDD